MNNETNNDSKNMEYTKDNPLRVFEAFAGYGSQSMALERLRRENPEFDFKVVGISEIDKYAVASYNAIHGETTNYGDISRIDWKQVPDFDLFTYSFPCTDISNAGQQKGLEEGTGTRSSLLWECRKAIEVKTPKYLLMENVKALTSEKFMPFFQKWQEELENFGYKNFWQIMNAKDYGVPQNRERVFMVSILIEGNKVQNFKFPAPIKLDKCLEDCLEDSVDESFYLNDARVKELLEQNDENKMLEYGYKVCKTE